MDRDRDEPFPPASPRFACDAMLKGLARRMRAWGYDATWRYGIGDGQLLDEAQAEDRIVVSADRELLGRRRVREGRPPALPVAPLASPDDQWRSIVRRLDLPLLPARCLACGGALRDVPKESVRDRAPPRSYRAFDRFLVCVRCGRLLWRGTHWGRIARMRRLVARHRTEASGGRSAAWR